MYLQYTSPLHVSVSFQQFKASYTLHYVMHKALAFTSRNFVAVRYYM